MAIKKSRKDIKDRDITPYPLAEAIAKAKAASKAKFDATVELHINLDIDQKKGDINIRYTTVLPNGTGKTKKVAVLASKKVANADLELLESDIEKIEKGKIKPKVDFDVLIAEPKFMPKLAKVAKILGPIGMMPNPKLGTVTDDVENAVTQTKKGKVEIKTEKEAMVIHTILGKASFDDKAIAENFMEIYKSLKPLKPAKSKPEWIKSAFIATTMGPAFSVALNEL
jgi:large subunit ribosomal protein L1